MKGIILSIVLALYCAFEYSVSSNAHSATDTTTDTTTSYYVSPDSVEFDPTVLSYLHPPLTADRLATYPSLNNSLLVHIDKAVDIQKTNAIRYPFCIHTIKIARDPQKEELVRQWAEWAVNSWIKTLAGQSKWRATSVSVYRVGSTTSCPSTDNNTKVYEIEISNLDGADNSPSSSSAMKMRMGNWGVAKSVVIHEVGHQIGLADTYSWDGHRPIGQPTAVMNNHWDINGVLQRDDVDGIRLVWARINGLNASCPAGYKIGGIEGTRPWNEIYCVLDGNGKATADLGVTLQGTNALGWATPYQFWKTGGVGTIETIATVSNQGDNVVNNASLNITIPEGVSYASSKTQQGSCRNSGREVICTLGTLPLKAKSQVTLTTKTNSQNRVLFAATASSSSTDSQPMNNTSTQLFGGTLNVSFFVSLMLFAGMRKSTKVNRSFKLNRS